MTSSSSGSGPQPPAHVEGVRILHLSALLGRPVTDRGGQTLGRLVDVIARLRGVDYPLVTGLVAKVGRREVFVPIEQVTSFGGPGVTLASARVDLRPFERRDGEVLIRTDVLGHRLIDVTEAHLVRASDVELARLDEQWLVSCVDTHRPRRLLGLFGDRFSGHACRDWKAFEALIGHTPSASLRGPVARIRGLKPAQIADLIEEASREEETEILGHVHQDPELEADVFEELEEDRSSRLLGSRTDEQIAEVLVRMRADDAADAIADLPQQRRQPVLDLLPAGQRTKVLTLMGFNPASAGGLMGVDFLAVPAATTAADALAAVAASQTLQPEALTSVYSLDEGGRLAGAVRLVSLVQADPAGLLEEITDTDPPRVGADTDIEDVAVLMTDYNLITVPVVDAGARMIGIITVDDVLEATLPADWRRREPPPPPDHPHDHDTHRRSQTGPDRPTLPEAP